MGLIIKLIDDQRFYMGLMDGKSKPCIFGNFLKDSEIKLNERVPWWLIDGRRYMGILVISFGNEQNCLGKEQNFLHYDRCFFDVLLHPFNSSLSKQKIHIKT